MTKLKRVVLDVLKPHQPNIIDFANAVSAVGQGYRVTLKVDEMDEKTETVLLTVEGQEIDFEALKSVINELGASLHSIDEVEVFAQDSIEERGA